MVQMKVTKRRLLRLHDLLYIPHGSDESHLTEIKALKVINFISHMVQMKAEYLFSDLPQYV